MERIPAPIKVDAVARAHGEPVSYVPSEWVKILKTFKDRFGQRIPEDYLPAQCYFEAFEEKINEGRLRSETLAKVISLEEEEAPERSNPEHPKQLYLTLEANLTLQTRRHRDLQEELCLSTSAGELRVNGGSRLEPLPQVRVPTPQRRIATCRRRGPSHRCSTLGNVQLPTAPYGTLDHFSHSGQRKVRKRQTSQEHSLGEQSHLVGEDSWLP